MRYDLDAVYVGDEYTARKRETYREYMEVVEALFEPVSFLDLGCACGYTVEWCLERGIAAVGVEGASLAFEAMPEGVKPHVVKHDLRDALDLGRTFGVVNCTEVAEHLEAQFEGALLDTIARHATGWVVFTASPDYDKFRGTARQQHWNVQPRTYWMERLEARGLSVDGAKVAEMRLALGEKRSVYPWWADDLIVARVKQ